MLEGLGSDNLTKVIMEALTIGGVLPRYQITQKLIYFGANGVSVFQGTKNGVIKQIHNTYALDSIGVHCMIHCTNLAIQVTLLELTLVVQIESLLQCLYSYFAHSPKRQLEFTKIIEFMATKGNKKKFNVKIRWISMLNPTNKVMENYKTLLMKMALDSLTNHQIMLNYEHLCDLHILLEFSCIFPFFDSMHVLSNLHNLKMCLCVIWC
jgi:hypothetical protein